MLVNRLKKVVGKVISEVQNAYGEGRQILDASFIAIKAVNSIMKIIVVALYVSLI